MASIYVHTPFSMSCTKFTGWILTCLCGVCFTGGEVGNEDVGGGEDLSSFHNHRPELGLYDTGMGGIEQTNSIDIPGY